MSTDPAPKVIVPNPGPPKTIGILNIIFGGLLTLMGLWYFAMAAIMPSMSKMMQSQQKQVQAQTEARQQERIKQQLAELAEQEAKAESDEEKARIRADMEQVKNAPKPFVPNTMIGLEMANDPAVTRVNFWEAVTGLLLNIPMIVAGFGLVRLAEWGRTLSIWVAAAKLLRGVIIAGVMVVVVVPIMAKMMDQQFSQMGQQIAASKPGNPGQAARVQQTMKQTSSVMGAVLTVSYVGYYLVAAIYPVVMIAVLTRPRARAACLAASKPRPDADLLA